MESFKLLLYTKRFNVMMRLKIEDNKIIFSACKIKVNNVKTENP